MEKGKIITSLDSTKNSISKYLSFFIKMIKDLISKVSQITDQDLKKRITSAAILIPVAIYAICFSQILFFFIAIILTIIMTAEWLEITETAQDKQKWKLIGLAYIAIPICCVIKIRMIDSNILLWMFAVIWTTDIFAFFSGKMFGGRKLAPAISPNKTWSGLAGGVIASMFIGLLSSVMFQGGVLFFIIISAILSLIEQAGDLFESKVKRIFGVKDSGSIIPGHGGVLDRLDGMMSVAPAVIFFIIIFSESFKP
jgi:phosphatidate cytidylyltransferase